MLQESHSHKVYNSELDKVRKRVKMFKMILEDLLRDIDDIEERTTHNEKAIASLNDFAKPVTSFTQFTGDFSNDFDNFKNELDAADISSTQGSSDGITTCLVLSDNLKLEFSDSGEFEELYVKEDNGETDLEIMFTFLKGECGFDVEEVYLNDLSSLVLNTGTSFDFNDKGVLIDITRK